MSNNSGAHKIRPLTFEELESRRLLAAVGPNNTIQVSLVAAHRSTEIVAEEIHTTLAARVRVEVADRVTRVRIQALFQLVTEDGSEIGGLNTEQSILPGSVGTSPQASETVDLDRTTDFILVANTVGQQREEFYIVFDAYSPRDPTPNDNVVSIHTIPNDDGGGIGVLNIGTFLEDLYTGLGSGERLLSVDVDGDGFLSPVDALQVINNINAPPLGPTTPRIGLSPHDVNGDGTVSPLDALSVINSINTNGQPQSQVAAEGEIVITIPSSVSSDTIDPIAPLTAKSHTDATIAATEVVFADIASKEKVELETVSPSTFSNGDNEYEKDLFAFLEDS